MEIFLMFAIFIVLFMLPTLAWNFDLFSKGRARQVRNLLRTEREDASIFIFDYQYQTGGGKNSQTHHQTVEGDGG